MRIGLTYNLRGSSGGPMGSGERATTADRGTPRSRAAATSAPDAPSATASVSRDDFDEEFDTPETIAAIAAALESLGHEVELLGVGEPLVQRLARGCRPDLVFNLAEGCGSARSREAQVPALLEMLGLAYTGSDPLALGLALDKECAKRLVQAAGVATPRWTLFAGRTAATDAALDDLTLPVIVKPAFEGSSKGIFATSVIERRDELVVRLCDLSAAYRQPILVEEFIDGDELTVGLVGNPPQVLGIMRVVPRERQAAFVYSLEVKRDWRRRVRYECPAVLAPAAEAAVRQAALNSWRAMGCRDVARCDFRLRDGVPYFLEANPLPGLTPGSSDLVILAERVGIGYRELIDRILRAAIARTELSASLAGGSIAPNRRETSDTAQFRVVK